MNFSIRLVLSVSLAALLLSGCSTKRPETPTLGTGPITPHPEPPRIPPITHKVRPGETLACIAKWYSGSENQWQAIVGYNPGINPRILQVNDVIKIPPDIATAHKQQSSLSLASRCKQIHQIKDHRKKVTHPKPPTPTPSAVWFGPK
jgi:LysM repeat protein